MRLLVLGGTGFVGSFVVRDLAAAGHEVVVLRRGTGEAALPPGVGEVVADRRRLEERAAALRALAPEVVVDAILSSGAQARTLMDVFRGVARRVIALGSMDVYRAYGILHGLEEGPLEPVPLREDSALRSRLRPYPPAQVAALQGLFGWLDDEYDKIPVERAVLGEAELPGTVLRLPMVYGPGDRLHRLFPLVRRMDDGRRAIPIQAGLAGWRAPRGYVENVAAAVALAATDERAARRVYNVGEAESLTELEWARAVADAVGWCGALVPVPDEDMPAALRLPGNFAQHWAADTTRIRAELGYAERVPRAEAIRRTAAWERAHPPTIDPARLDYAAEDAAIGA